MNRPAAGAANHTGAVVNYDWGLTGSRYDIYVTQASLQYASTRAKELVGTVVCGLVATRNAYAGIGCGVMVVLWGDWLGSWIRAAATRGCLHITFVPLSIRAWRTAGFWIPPVPPRMHQWNKASVEIVPNAGPGGNCRAH